MASSSETRIFVDDQDVPLKIYVCSGTRHQFRLSKAIRNHGGHLVNSISQGQILIADSTEANDREFYERWNGEPGKVFLEPQWVFQSMRLGQWPDETDNWGGHLFRHDPAIHNPKHSEVGPTDIRESSVSKRGRKRTHKEMCQPVASNRQSSPSDPCPSPVDELPERASPCSTSPQVQVSSNPVIITRKQLFTREDGTPLAFYVQVNLRNRMSILGCIRRGGGKITPQIADCDYMILDPGSKQFGILAVEDRLIFSPSWPHQCEQSGMMLEDENIKTTSPKQARKKSRRGRSRA